MKCDICDRPAVINDLCQALRAAEMFQLRIADIKIESNKIHDALERNSEVIKALRNEIATKDKRIKELEAELTAIAEWQELVTADGRTYSEGCTP